MAKDNFDPTLIVGIGRGGAVMGAFLSGHLGHRPLIAIDPEYRWVNGSRVEDMLISMPLPNGLTKKVLLVGGECHTGRTMRLFEDFLKHEGGAMLVKKAVFYYRNSCRAKIDYFYIHRDGDGRMPWMFSKNYIRTGTTPIDPGPDGKLDRRVFIIRHGTSIENEGPSEPYAGITDPLLSELGNRQAEQVGRALHDQRVHLIITSPMKRAVNTAREIEKQTGGYIRIEERLREIDYGIFEGLTKNEVNEKFPIEYAAYNNDPVKNFPPRGESPIDVLSRLQRFWKDLLSAPQYTDAWNIVLVSHHAIIRILLGMLKGDKLGDYRNHRDGRGKTLVRNGSISTIIIGKHNKPIVQTENDTSHFQ